MQPEGARCKQWRTWTKAVLSVLLLCFWLSKCSHHEGNRDSIASGPLITVQTSVEGQSVLWTHVMWWSIWSCLSLETVGPRKRRVKAYFKVHQQRGSHLLPGDGIKQRELHLLITLTHPRGCFPDHYHMEWLTESPFVTANIRHMVMVP